jgi:surfactin synthase thioesterase subunit
VHHEESPRGAWPAGDGQPSPSIERPLQLFCLPYAGASARIYARWQELLPRWVEVRPLELPGRGRRMAEPPERDIGRLVEHLSPEVRSASRGPLAIFGHSMGAILGFELARALEHGGRPSPAVLFASGADAPSRRDPERYRLLDTDSDLISELQRLRGTPEAVLRNADLMSLALPILRADFAACAGYRPGRGAALRCPIHAFGGSSDSTTAATLAAWGNHTTGGFGLDMLPGGHFFLHEQEAQLLHRIEVVLRAVTGLHDAGDSAPRGYRAGHDPLPSKGAAECQLR